MTAWIVLNRLTECLEFPGADRMLRSLADGLAGSCGP